MVRFGYNALEQETYKMDQAGNVMEFTYDTSGRRTAEKATTVVTADGFSNWVERIAWAFDSLGRVSTVTQYDDPSAGNVINEVKYTYDDWGLISKYEQDHNSTVATGGNQYYDVDYTYAKATTGRNTIRRATMDLPSGNQMTFQYSSAGDLHDDEISRVTRVQDGAVNLSRYWYNGAGHVVGTDLPEADVWSRQYSGSTFPELDSFNRATSKWTKDLATDVEFFDIDITYDRNSNIAWVEDNIHTGFDVKYTIDNLNRLTDAQEGTRNGSSISSETRQQTWTLLDQLGNWDHVKLDLNGDNSYTGANEYDDDRTHSVVNELTARDTDDNGTDNFTLVYDKVGNLTDDNEDYEYEYDVWGRLVQINPTGTANVVAKFEYNGLHHRTLAHHDTDTDGDVDVNDTKLWLAYNERWQLMAAYENTESTPREEWVYHNAGASGRGSSSYIDSVAKRWWDADNNGTLDTESYFCQNWRHDVVALVTDTGKLLEWAKYSSYGIAFGMPVGDTDSDGDWDSTDSSNITGLGGYDVRKDADLDGDADSADVTHANSITGGYQTLGWNVLSSTGVANFKGYAGYEWDRSAPELYHVRFRVLNNKLGRWTRRDPLGYVDGQSLYEYVGGRALIGVDPTGTVSLEEILCHITCEVGCVLACTGTGPALIACHIACSVFCSVLCDVWFEKPDPPAPQFPPPTVVPIPGGGFFTIDCSVCCHWNYSGDLARCPNEFLCYDEIKYPTRAEQEKCVKEAQECRWQARKWLERCEYEDCNLGGIGCILDGSNAPPQPPTNPPPARPGSGRPATGTTVPEPSDSVSF